MKNLSIFRRFHTHSMSTKLIFSFLLIIFVPTIIISLFTFSNFRSYIRKTYYNDATSSLYSYAQIVNLYFSQIDILTSNALLSTDLQTILNQNADSGAELLNNQRFFRNFAVNLVGKRSDVEGVYLFGLNGENYFETETASAIKYRYKLSEDNLYKKFINLAGELLIWVSDEQSYKEKNQSKRIICFARKIQDLQTNKDLGLFLIEIKYSVISNLFTMQENSDHNIIFIDKRNNITFDGKNEKINLSLLEMYNFIEEKEDSLVSNDESILLAQQNTDYGWSIIKLIGLNALFNEIRSTLFPIMIITVMCSLAFLIISFFLVLNVTKPIKILEETVKAIEKGDLDRRVRMHCGGEVERLGNSFNKMVSQLQDLINKVYRSEIEEVKANYKALQSQINPHFLYNTLEEINCMAQLADEKDISLMIRSLAKIFKYCTDQRQSSIALREEIEHVKNYLFLITLNNERQCDITYNIDNSLLDCVVPKMIIQPIVENTFKHGFKKTSKNGKYELAIGTAQNNDNVFVTVTDNGKGISNRRLTEIKNQLNGGYDTAVKTDKTNGSIGLLNINLRLKLLYGDDGRIEIESEENEGTDVTITLKK